MLGGGGIGRHAVLSRRCLNFRVEVWGFDSLPSSLSFRGVAQSGSASGLGPEGRRFKSCLPDHLFFLKSL